MLKVQVCACMCDVCLSGLPVCVCGVCVVWSGGLDIMVVMSGCCGGHV